MGGGSDELPTSSGNGVPRDVDRIYAGLSKSNFPEPYNPYSEGYNPRVHGPYDPQRYYGSKQLVCWWNVKLKDLPLRIFEADTGYRHVVPTVSRWANKMSAKWARPRRGFPMLPFIGALMAYYMVVRHSYIHSHKMAVHHW